MVLAMELVLSLRGRGSAGTFSDGGVGMGVVLGDGVAKGVTMLRGLLTLARSVVP